ncbi:Arm DNA-binding domain-containing protein [Bordetella sp. FB-8]|uniref:tyrosine-type recombinase/integrase n=1 Tax=Bordetella sp. FB-8 TaxID=1159870 RepID=UPI001E45DEDA|nr:Arm DNA-binding domain-containing protein [Bordetella sp. FB-8]
MPDGGTGLYLKVMPAGGKLWRWNYRYLGKQKTLAYGTYQDVGLAKALERHQEARKLLDDGIDPAQARKDDKRAAKLATINSFEAVACAWMAERQPSVSVSTHTHTMGRMKTTCSRGWASAPLLKSMPLKFWMSSSALMPGGRGTARTRCGRKSA